MFAICLESSHSKGMGHLFRMLNFATYLKRQNVNFIFVVNEDNILLKTLKKNNIFFITVDLKDPYLNWEDGIIKRYGIKYWINDRLDTSKQHAKNVLNLDVKLITFDDMGEGAALSDLNVCGLFFNHAKVSGRTVLRGAKYLILNSEINLYKRERKGAKNILVTLGGSDTYGATIKVLKLLIKNNLKATIHIGPSFQHKEELLNLITQDYQVIENVASLMQEFSKYGLAITGGGITPFEANASGLPCLVIANEDFEIPNGRYLDKIGSSRFLGLHTNLNDDILNSIPQLNIRNMSNLGMSSLDTGAVEKIYNKILKL
jgi:spore coat polysaccharide biosynthesis predicted glycosyltransferase SpsG